MKTLMFGAYTYKDAEGINLTNKGEALIVDKNNSVIASTGEYELPGFLHYDNLSSKSGLLYGQFMDEKSVVSYISSGVNNWKYISVIPARIFWEKAEYIRKSTLASLLFCLVLGCLLSYFLVKRNYNPLEKLIKSIGHQNSLNYFKKSNEFELIQQSINEASDEKKQLNYRIRLQNKVLRNTFLTGLLKGKGIYGIPVDDSLSAYDIVFESEYFAVMIFYIEDMGDFGNQNENPEHSEMDKLIQLILTNVAEELANRNNIGFMTEVDNLMVCLLNFKHNAVNDWKGEISRIAEEACDFIYAHYRVRLIVSASDLHETVAGIPDAYNETVQTMQYKKVFGIRNKLFHDEIIKLPKGNYYYPLEKEYQLLNCVRKGDIERANILLDEVFQKNFTDAVLPVHTATYLMFDLTSTMIKMLNEVDSEKRDAFLEELGPIETILQYRNITEMKLRMKTAVERICRYAGEKDKNNSLQVKVTEYIKGNYHDCNLTVSAIAEHFDMHPVYLSKVFKEQSGVGLLDWIGKVRVTEAKKLLSHSKNNIDEIARKMGYTNVRTFTRVFIRNEGITPGKFRKED